jgi:hypothetical protein
MKICTKCNIKKEDHCFTKSVAQCKECRAEYSKQYNKANKEKRAEYTKQYRKLNVEKLKKYMDDNKERFCKAKQKYYKENKTIILKRNKQYHLANKEKRNIFLKQYAFNKRKNDIMFKFKHNVRMLILTSFKRKNHRKKSKTADILGCSIEEFKSHIERQFTKGMSWEKLGDIHLDHIIPLATAKTEEDVIKLNHYTNFQPLWANDNLKKSDKIIEKQLVLI